MHHSSFTVSDMDRSIAFYRDFLGMKLLMDTQQMSGSITGAMVEKMNATTESQAIGYRLAFLSVGGKQLELVQYTPQGRPQHDNMASDTGNGHVCFITDDIQQLYEKLVANKFRVHCAPQDMGNSKVIYFRDPDGVVLEAFEGKVPG